MAVNSKIDICNMALARLGNYGTITNIDTPTNEKEISFSLWYDISRQSLLKMSMPNFAMARKKVAVLSEVNPFGYEKVYEYPNDCLRVLGMGNIADKENNYSVEGNRIYTDQNYPEGLPLRYIKDITDVTKFSPEFKELLSWYLAANIALDITQDGGKANNMFQVFSRKLVEASGLNAQENMPIRISHSRFKMARSGRFKDITKL